MSRNGKDPPGKRQCKQAPENCTEGSGGSEVLVEFPSLLVEVFIGTLRNVKLLKKCRLVCKSWNVAASRVLRSRSIVMLDESKSLEDFKILLANRAFGTLASMPSPFQNFHVVPTYFYDDFFKSLIHLPSFVTTDLSLTLANHSPEVDQYQLEVFLECKRAEITDLTIKGKKGFYLDAELSAREDLQLTSLRRVTFSDDCHPHCTHIPFMKNVLRNSCLESVELNIRDSDVLIQLLTEDNVRGVKSLELTFVDLSTEGWNALGNLQMPALRILKIENTDVENAIAHANQFASLVNNVAGTLEVLQSRFVRLELLSVLPKLQELEVWRWENKFSQLRPQQFPLLQNVSLSVKGTIWKFLENDFDPHPGVDTFLIHVDVETQDSIHSVDKHLPIFLTYLSRQFPKVKSFCLGIPKFSPATFRDIHRAFPKLKKLGMNAACTLQCMSGAQMSLVNNYLEAGWPLERLPRSSCIFDFVELKQLFLGRKVIITHDLLTYCLSKIPTLKSLEFYWNPELTVQEVRDCLGHLGRISIYNLSGDPATRDELERVLPNVHF